VYVADGGNNTIRKVTPGGNVSTLAGQAGQVGSVDGSGSAARFDAPAGVATDSTGNVYVTESAGQTIRKITPAGTVSTLAGAASQIGSADGSGSAARFYGPSGIAIDSAGNMYVADAGNDTIRKITPDGTVSTLAGTAQQSGSADGSGAAARFLGPSGVATDSMGTVYVADYSNSTIRRISRTADVSTFAGTAEHLGSVDGIASVARFNYPTGVSLDSAGNIYVADFRNNTIRKITPAGNVTTLAGAAGEPGSADGIGSAARFNNPAGVATDSAGNVYVADSENGTIRKITPDGSVSTFAGTVAGRGGAADGTGSAAQFNVPDSVAIDSADNIYVADSTNQTVRKITPAGVVTTLAGAAKQEGSVDGIGSAARFSYPTGIAVDTVGNVYVADNVSSVIRKITPDGNVSTLAGAAYKTGSTEGSGNAARFNNPTGVSVDSAGNVYVADSGNDTLRKITPAGTVTTVAGMTGVRGDQIGDLPGSLNQPLSLAVIPGASVRLLEVDVENAVLEILP
jgi:sugar lactone lactonase YvrE